MSPKEGAWHHVMVAMLFHLRSSHRWAEPRSGALADGLPYSYSEEFSSLAWVNYDLAFRRQAAATGNRQWSRVNPPFYSTYFAAVVRSTKWCDLCFSLLSWFSELLSTKANSRARNISVRTMTITIVPNTLNQCEQEAMCGFQIQIQKGQSLSKTNLRTFIVETPRGMYWFNWRHIVTLP